MASATTQISDARMVQRAAVRAVAYADVFGYPLDAGQIHRYLHGIAATEAATRSALERAVGGALAHRDGFYMLRGREHLADERRRRAEHATALWPVAVWYAQQFASLPFVRMVAVTGSLAWDNVEAGGDIDYLVVTEPDRLWVCRWFVAVLTETVRLAGVPLCPNFIISERALAMKDRNLYTAYELAQMRPISGFDTYREMREANRWVQTFLPNTPPNQPAEHDRWPPHAGAGRLLVRAARLLEPVLRSRIGATLDRLEMRYRVYKWTGRGPRRPEDETAYDVDCYKAHNSGHMTKVIAAFTERLQRLEAQAPA